MLRLSRCTFLSVLVWLSIPISAQRFYWGFGPAYNENLAGQSLAVKIDNGLTETSNALVHGSFGKGISVDAYGGFRFHRNVSVETALSYLQGARFNGEYVKDTSLKQELTMTSNMLRLAPGLRIAMEENKLRPYFRFAALFRVSSTIRVQNSNHDYVQDIHTVTNWKYTHGFSIGIASALGSTYYFNEKFSLFAEITSNNQSWAPKKGTVTSHKVNGEEMVTTLSPSQKHTEFTSGYTVVNGQFSTWEPKQQLKQYHPFNSVGLRLGIHFLFGRKKTDS